MPGSGRRRGGSTGSDNGPPSSSQRAALGALSQGAEGVHGAHGRADCAPGPLSGLGHLESRVSHTGHSWSSRLCQRASLSRMKACPGPTSPQNGTSLVTHVSLQPTRSPNAHTTSSHPPVSELCPPQELPPDSTTTSRRREGQMGHRSGEGTRRGLGQGERAGVGRQESGREPASLLSHPTAPPLPAPHACAWAGCKAG